MPSPSPFEITSGDGVSSIYENGRFIPSAWGIAWGNSWGSSWGWNRKLHAYTFTAKPPAIEGDGRNNG